MRKIKFRAWDTNNKVMELPEVSRISMDFEGLIYWGNSFNPSFQERFEVMQFTGIIDENGKEIYEGDIVEDAEGHIFYVGVFLEGFCLFDNNGVWWSISDYKDADTTDGYCLEVIGNKFENLELLK